MTPGADPPRDRTWDDSIHAIPDDVYRSLDEQIAQAGGLWQEGPEDQDCAGRTMFDTPNSEDGTLTVLLPAAQMERLQSQSLVRIESRRDGRTYLGVVVKGPFADPDGLRADAPIVVTTSVRGGSMFLPRYHGRVQVEVMGERRDGLLVPPSRRPLPNSPVFPLGDEETAAVLRVAGNVRLGVAESHEQLEVRFPTTSKLVLPRHTGILGTTGGGKSTTVSRLIDQAQRQGFAVILLDTEGEYTLMNEPTEDETMLELLEEREEQAHGIDCTELYVLADKRTSNPGHPNKKEFDLSFERFSPFIVEELLDLTSAQAERFTEAYETAKALLRELNIFPRRDSDEEKRMAIELNEMETGYPRMRLDHVIDVARMIHDSLYGSDLDESVMMTSDFRSGEGRSKLKQKAEQAAGKLGNKISWRALLGHLHRLRRLRVFDSTDDLDYGALLRPGCVSIFDLSDSDSPQVNNLVIADVLRGVQDRQDAAYRSFEDGGDPPTRVLIVIEEAHEFLSDERVTRMPFLFQQVARIAKRGRKRWLGLVFVTQLPRHLPPQVLGLVNNWVLHRISDADTISRLRRSVAGVDDALWQRLPGLAPGQAIVSFTSMTRPLLAAVDPTPAKLRMLD